MAPPLTQHRLWFLRLLSHTLRGKFRWSLVSQSRSGLSQKSMPFSSTWQGNESHGNPFPQQRPRARRPVHQGPDTFPAPASDLGGWEMGSIDTSVFLFCLLRNSKLHICVTSLKSSFLRTPDRQSQSWTDTPSCCSDVSFFQSFAAKNISSAFDFPVANNGL